MTTWRWLAAHPRRVVALTIVVLLVTTGVGWVVAARSAADHVSVSWTVDCPEGTLQGAHDHPVIQSRSGWRCEVALSIRNASGRSVKVDHIDAPFFGSGADAEIRGYSTDAARLRDVDKGDNDVDGVYDVDLTVAAHSSRTLTLPIGWREQGCQGDGQFGLPDWPSVEFRLGWVTFHRSPRQTLDLRTYDDPHDMDACAD